MHGYDRFEATLPTGPSGGLTTEQRRERLVRSILTGAGLSQAINLPFVNPGDLTQFIGAAESSLLTVKNPLRDEESKLRPTMLPGLLNSVRYNRSHGTSSVALFEVGKVFTSTPDAADPRLPEQFDRLAWVIVGHVGIQSVDANRIDADGRVSIGVWRLLAQHLGLQRVELRSTTLPGWHPGRTARVELEGRLIGHVGELSPLVARQFDIDARVAVAEIDLAPLIAPVPPAGSSSPSVFPPVDFDLSFVVPTSIPAGRILRVTRDAGEGLVETSRVFDEFTGGDLGADERALAIRYRLRAPDRTLTNEEVAPIRDAMIEAAHGLGARLRGA